VLVKIDPPFQQRSLLARTIIVGRYEYKSLFKIFCLGPLVGNTSPITGRTREETHTKPNLVSRPTFLAAFVEDTKKNTVVGSIISTLAITLLLVHYYY